MRYVALLVILAQPALAEVSFEEGAYFIYHREYHHETNTFTDGAPEGEAEACFQITDVRPDKIDIVLRTGTYTPWWTDGEVLQPGFTDTYVNYNDNAFAEKNPGRDWRDLMREIWKTVPSCPAPGA